MNVFNSLLHYYLREKLWRSAINLCNDELKKGKDNIVSFWRGLAHFQEGSIIDAIRDCEPLQNSRDLRFSSVNAMIFYYNHYSATDNVTYFKTSFLNFYFSFEQKYNSFTY